MNFVLFQTLYAGIITPVLAQMQAMMGPMCAAMQPVALILISIWLCFAAWDLQMRTKTLHQIGKELFTAVLLYSLLWIGQYTEYVSDFFLQILPNTISAALGGNGTPITQLDKLLGAAVSEASKVYEAMPSYSMKSAILSVGVLAFVIVAMICIAFIFIILCIAALINIVAIVVGPMFIAAATVPFARRFASGWLSVLVGGAVTQLLSLALIQLLVGAVQIMMTQLAATAQNSNANSIMMLYGLGELGIMLWLFKEVVKKIPELAQVIGGGVYHGSHAAMAATFGTAAAVTGAAVGGVTGGVGGAVQGAATTGTASGAALGAAGGAGRGAARGFRYASPAGRSLSRRS